MAQKTMTVEKLSSDLVAAIKGLESERDRLLAQRKDLKRFMDIEKEKEELAFLRSEKDKLIATAQGEADKIIADAKKSAERVMNNGNDNAHAFAESARKIETQAKEELAAAQEKSKALALKEDALKKVEAEAIERDKRLMFREQRVKEFKDKVMDALASL